MRFLAFKHHLDEETRLRSAITALLITKELRQPPQFHCDRHAWIQLYTVGCVREQKKRRRHPSHNKVPHIDAETSFLRENINIRFRLLPNLQASPGRSNSTAIWNLRPANHDSPTLFTSLLSSLPCSFHFPAPFTSLFSSPLPYLPSILTSLVFSLASLSLSLSTSLPSSPPHSLFTSLLSRHL